MIPQEEENHNTTLLSSDAEKEFAESSERLGELYEGRETHTLVSIADQNIATRQSEDVQIPFKHRKEREIILGMKFGQNDWTPEDVAHIKLFADPIIESPYSEAFLHVQQEHIRSRDLKLCQEYGCTVEELPTFEVLPRLVTRGPLPHKGVTPLPQKTKIDTLSFTAQEDFYILQDLLRLSISQDIKFLPRKSGTNGYRDGFNIVLNNQDLGILSYGSNHNVYQDQKPLIEIGGNGKTDKIDWQLFHYYANLLKSPTVKRIDIALDTFNGEISIEQVIEDHKNLKFKATNAPKNPKITPYGTLQPDGTNPGRTIYIGSLQSSKFIRFYEKAYEIFKRELNNDDPNASPTTLGIKKLFANGGEIEIEGFNQDKAIDIRKWVRAEIEFKSGNCEIPLDILVNQDQYFSGAYPYCKEILEMTDGKKPNRLMTEDELSLEVRIKNIKAIAGSLIDDLIILGYSNDQIIEQLKGNKGASQKLIRSGILK